MYKALFLLLTLTVSLPVMGSIPTSIDSSVSIHDTDENEPGESGTIPVIYINTENETPIIDKETQIPATFYMLSHDPESVENIGSADNPIALTIKGRGNSSWQKAKKPYKLKFNKKTSLFGLPKNKHYVLLAQFAQHTWLAYEMGFEISRNLGMKWTPRMIPVELVLNGKYEGVYFLCESVKIAEGRLDINEQEDGESDPEKIPYGWLIEIDNTDEENQVRFNEDGKKLILRFTFKSPEDLSADQMEWIESELKHINSILYQEPNEESEEALSETFDLKSFAQYFIIREILNDFDGYSGSFYIHRDSEQNPLWTAGPVWDLTLDRNKKNFYMAYDPTRPEWSAPHWFGQFMKFKGFEESFIQLWEKFYNEENLNLIKAYLKEYAENLQPAFDANNLRWEEEKYDIYNNYTQLNAKSSLEYVVDALVFNTNWINNHKNLVEYSNTPQDILSATHSVKEYSWKTDADKITFLNNDEKVGHCVLMTLDGLIMKTSDTNTIDIQGLPAGIYLARYLYTDGTSINRKVVLR